MDRSGQPDAAEVSIGAYFLSVKQFLEQDGFRSVARAVGRRSGRKVPVSGIEKLHLHLEKHGAFYHPSRLVVFAEKRVSFAVNVAVSPIGRRMLPIEVALLRRLSGCGGRKKLPRVYASGAAGPGGLKIFLAEWFDRFHEFHLTQSEAFGGVRLCLWNEDRRLLLSDGEERCVYRRASRLLTSLYDPDTFSQVFGWHHGAGDFVARLRPDGISVRLVTVRGYGPLVRFPKSSDENLRMALLLFLLDLSLRMRIDRLDGVGEVVWAGHRTLGGVLAGFRQGVTQSLAKRRSFLIDFLAGIHDVSPSEWCELAAPMAASGDRDSEEAGLIRENLADHLLELTECLGRGDPKIR